MLNKLDLRMAYRNLTASPERQIHGQTKFNSVVNTEHIFYSLCRICHVCFDCDLFLFNILNYQISTLHNLIKLPRRTGKYV